VTITWREYLLYTAIAKALHAVVFWHVRESGDFIPFLMPVTEETWRLIGGPS
jgi:hypothetical protein